MRKAPFPGGRNFSPVLFFRSVFALDDGINSTVRYLRNFSGDEISLAVPSRPGLLTPAETHASVTSICERPRGIETEKDGEREREKIKYKRDGGNEKFFTSHATSPTYNTLR